MATVTLERLVKRYGPVEAVRERSIFRSRSAKFVALVGPSGCGKSTTLQNDRGARGDFVWNDTGSAARSSTIFRRARGTFRWCSSPTRSIRTHMSVRENMALLPQDR